jgi:hypothetical protein
VQELHEEPTTLESLWDPVFVPDDTGFRVNPISTLAALGCVAGAESTVRVLYRVREYGIQERAAPAVG